MIALLLIFVGLAIGHYFLRNTPQVQELSNGQAEPQRPQEAIPREVQGSISIIVPSEKVQQLREEFDKIYRQSISKAAKEAFGGSKVEYRGLLAKDLSQAVDKGLNPEKCKECCGTGLDHPCSYKSRNTDDDTCPHCKGTGIEPTPSPQQEQASSDYSKYYRGKIEDEPVRDIGESPADDGNLPTR